MIDAIRGRMPGGSTSQIPLTENLVGPFHWITVPIALRSLERCVLGQKALANVPADARLISCWRDVLGRPRREMLLLKFEHPSFPPVPDGGRVPRVKPVWSVPSA